MASGKQRSRETKTKKGGERGKKGKIYCDPRPEFKNLVQKGWVRPRGIKGISNKRERQIIKLDQKGNKGNLT